MTTRRGFLKGLAAATGALVLDSPKINGQPLLWTPDKELMIPEQPLGIGLYDVIETDQPVREVGWIEVIFSELQFNYSMLDTTAISSRYRESASWPMEMTGRCRFLVNRTPNEDRIMRTLHLGERVRIYG